MAGHAQLKFVMTECSKTQIRLARLILMREALLPLEILLTLITDGDPRHLIRISKSYTLAAMR